MHMIITFSASTRWSPTAAPPSTGGGAFPFVHLSPLPCDHNIWFHRAPYTCLRLIKPWPGPWTHFLYFSATFTGSSKGWWILGQETAGEVRLWPPGATAQRTKRSSERWWTEPSIKHGTRLERQYQLEVFSSWNMRRLVDQFVVDYFIKRRILRIY